MDHFKPIGELARWRVLYNKLISKKTDEQITYLEAAEELGLDSELDKPTIRSAFHRAGTELERVNKRCIAPVRGVGYRVVQAREHQELAVRHQGKAQRATKRGLSKARNTNRNELNANERARLDQVELVLGRQAAFNKEVAKRLQHHDAALTALDQRVDERSERTDEELAAMKERLERLERMGWRAPTQQDPPGAA